MSSPRNDIAYVEDMLARVRRIRGKTQGVTWERFRDDEDLHDIVERSISIVGEAARKVSGEFRDAHPEVPWVDTMNIRHKIVHDYFEVSYTVLWSVIKEELPALELLLSSLVEE
jgi:uncharacterized protein with HEPN domain